MRHDNLKLARGEKASRAGELPMSEMHVVFVRDSVLMSVLLVRLPALLVVAEPVEVLGVWKVGRIFGDGVGGGANMSAGGKLEAIREGEWSLNDTVKAH